jgi:hypothetical protein
MQVPWKPKHEPKPLISAFAVSLETSTLEYLMQDLVSVCKDQGHDLVWSVEKNVLTDSFTVDVGCENCLNLGTKTITNTMTARKEDGWIYQVVDIFRGAFSERCIFDRLGILAAGVTCHLAQMGDLPESLFIQTWLAGGGKDPENAVAMAKKINLVVLPPYDYRHSDEDWYGLPPGHPMKEKT